MALLCDRSPASLTSVTAEGSTDHLKTDATLLECKYLKSTHAKKKKKKKKKKGKIRKKKNSPFLHWTEFDVTVFQ